MTTMQGAARRKTQEDADRVLRRASLGIHRDTELIDPVVNLDSIPDLAQLRETTQVFDQHQQKRQILQTRCKKELQNKWYSVWLAQGVLAVAVAGVVVLLLYVVNPPITQEPRKEQYVSEKQSWKKVLIVTVFVFLLVLLLPEFIRLVNQLLYKRKTTAAAAAASNDDGSTDGEKGSNKNTDDF